MNTGLSTLPPVTAVAAPVVLPLITASDLKKRKKAVDDVMNNVMRNDTHYGVIPGTKKHSLYKAGAEVLCSTFGLVPVLDSWVVADDPDRTWDWVQRRKQDDGTWVDEEGTAAHWLEVSATCRILGPSGNLLSQASASANSWELKYRKQLNPDVRNTVVKMAEKRALIAAVLLATACSDIFTQDVEDGPGGVERGSKPGGGASRPQGNIVSVLTEKQIAAARAKGHEMGIPPAVIEAALKGVTKAGAKAFMDGVFNKQASVFDPWKDAANAPAPAAGGQDQGKAPEQGQERGESGSTAGPRDEGWPEDAR